MPTQQSKQRRGRYHHGDLRTALIDQTLALIAKKGVEGVSLRDVARALGVSEAAPYHHFDSKAQLIVHVALRGYRQLAPCLERAIATAPEEPYARLRAFGRAYIEFGLADEGRFRAMFGSHMVNARLLVDPEQAAGGTRAYATLVRMAAEIAVAQGAPERRHALERVIWSACHGAATLVLAQELRYEDGATVDEFITDALDMLVAGVGLVARSPSTRETSRA